MNHIVTAVGVTIASVVLILFLDYKMRSYTKKLYNLEARCQSIRDQWLLMNRIRVKSSLWQAQESEDFLEAFNVERKRLEAEMAEIEGQL